MINIGAANPKRRKIFIWVAFWLSNHVMHFSAEANVDNEFSPDNVFHDTQKAARAAQAALRTKFPDRNPNPPIVPLPLEHQEQQVQPYHNQEAILQQAYISPMDEEEYAPIAEAITIDENSGKPLPFPVFNNPDDRVPDPAMNTVASEILDCRDNVMQFITHASDNKDECEGLKRAYEANCAIMGAESPFAGSLTMETVDGGLHRRLSFLPQPFNRNKEQMMRRLFDAWNKVIFKNNNRRLQVQVENYAVENQEEHLLQQQQESNVQLLQEQQQKFNLRQNPVIQSAAQNFFETLEEEELKTCCSSIQTVFHEHCERKEEDELKDSRLFIIVAVIAICLMVKSLIKTFKIRWLPEAAGCILVGVIGGVILEFVPHMDFSFDEKFFLRVMLPPIVFEAALNIDKKAFLRHVIPITLYAIVGTILSTALTALIVFYSSNYLSPTYCTAIPFVDSLTFGALISSIDPIAVLSVLANMGMSTTDTLYVMVFGESLLNDGVAIVLFETLTHFLDDNLVIDAQAVMDASLHFIVVAVGSVIIGLSSGAFCTAYFWIMRGCHSPLVEVLTFFCWALLPYYVCDGVGWSGIVGLVATGFVMDLYVVGTHDKHYHGSIEYETRDRGEIANDENPFKSNSKGIFKQKGQLSDVAKRHVGFVTEINATLMETAIFAYLGLFLCSHRYHWNFFLTTISILACVLSRAMMIPFLSTVANFWMKSQMSKQRRRQGKDEENFYDKDDSDKSLLIIDRPLQIVLLFSGLRGAMSFALVENIPLFDSVTGHGSRLKPELKSMTSASIAFTVFILGGSTYYLLEYLGLTIKKDDESLEMATLLPPKTKFNDTEKSTFCIRNKKNDERFVRQRMAGKDSSS